MNHLQKHLSACLIALAALFSTAWAQAVTAPSLGTASSFTVLGGPKVTCTAPGSITGDVGVSSGPFVNTTGCVITGTVHAGDAVALAAYNDFLTAYGKYPAIGCGGTALDTAYGVGTVTLTPGVYCNGAAVTFNYTTLILDAQGDPNAVWIFKIGTGGSGALTGTGFTVAMINGGQPCNVYWWVNAATTMTDSNFAGTILAGAAITMTSGTNTLAGRALATAEVTMTNASVIGCGALAAAAPGAAVCVVTPPPPPPPPTCDTNHKHHKNCKLHDYDPPHCDGNDDGHDGGSSSSFPWSNDKNDSKRK